MHCTNLPILSPFESVMLQICFICYFTLSMYRGLTLIYLQSSDQNYQSIDKQTVTILFKTTVRFC